MLTRYTVPQTGYGSDSPIRGEADSESRWDVAEHNVPRYARVGDPLVWQPGNRATERVWSRQRSKELDPRIERVALRKLAMLDAAEVLDDLRICFTWTAAGPEHVAIVDYH